MKPSFYYSDLEATRLIQNIDFALEVEQKMEVDVSRTKVTCVDNISILCNTSEAKSPFIDFNIDELTELERE